VDAATSTDRSNDNKSGEGITTYAPTTPTTPAPNPMMDKLSTFLGSEVAVFTGCARSLRRHWEDFRNAQTELITEALISGKLVGPDKSIRITQLFPSIWDVEGDDHVRGRATPVRFERTRFKKRRPYPLESHADTSGNSPEKNPAYPEELPGDDEQSGGRLSSSYSLIRVLSLIYSLR
jgi:hypothetical protein